MRCCRGGQFTPQKNGIENPCQLRRLKICTLNTVFELLEAEIIEYYIIKHTDGCKRSNGRTEVAK